MVQTNGKLLLYKRSLVTGKKKKEKKKTYMDGHHASNILI